jgi:Ca2+-binding RTX toxin-like protein
MSQRLSTSPASRSARKAPARQVRPELESLEKRDLMAAYISGGNLIVAGTNYNDSAIVSDTGTLYKVTLNSTVKYFSKSAVTTGRVYFYGYNGNDYFNNLAPALQVVAYGGYGNDTMYGDARNDYLYGSYGNDYLNGWTGNDVVSGEADNDRVYGYSGNDYVYGGTGNDKCYGGSGTDVLYGQDGNDWLDAGSWWEFADGGAGTGDFNAYVWSVGGATASDVRQGYAPVCSLVSSISAVAHSGVNLASRISYLGNGLYRVGIYNTSGVYTYVNVSFEGDTYGADAIPAAEGESWVLLTQRAYLISRGLSVTNPPSLWPSEALTALTGRTSYTYWKGSGFGLTDMVRISNELSAGRTVVAWTPNSTPAVNTLVANHAYTVMSINVFFNWATWQWDATVVVRNPWGYDGATASGSSTDGLITLSWAQFNSGMTAYTTN